MSVEENGIIGRRFFEEQDLRKGPLADELCAPGYTAYIPGSPPMDFEGHSQFGLMFYAAFPDLGHTIEDTIAEEDSVAVRFTLSGTHEGDFMGLPATGRRITVSAIAILRIAGGKVTGLHAVFDALGLMQQLGAIPEPGGEEA